MDYSIKIGGAAGQGIQTIGNVLSKTFARSGFHLFSYQDYESRIRGGHNFYQIRVADRPVFAPRAKIDLLFGLDRESIPRHREELSEAGVVVYDSGAVGGNSEEYGSAGFVGIPLAEMGKGHGGEEIMGNMVASGAVLGMLGMEVDTLVEVIEESKFAAAGAGEGNVNAAKAGHGYARDNCPSCSFSVEPGEVRMMVIGGNEAIALAALASDCRFYAAYPMTPSTGILNYMAAHEKQFGIVVEQAEDEIAAVNMALGASFAGVRSMTGTSGGGFALMVEGISLSGMTETPVVIALGQRPAPATGLPTRTEQADLQFALHAGHGEFPRALFAPGNPYQFFRQVSKAFDLAEKYQIPAIILTDQHLADARWTLPKIDPDVFESRDYRLRGKAFRELPGYRRHAFTESGVTPLAVPGDAPFVVVTDSDEHDQEGHITEDAGIRRKMVEKRYAKKIGDLTAEMGGPLHYGSGDPELLITCWGSNYGVVREAVDELSGRVEAAMLHFSEICPFPPVEKYDYLDSLHKSKRSVCVENNATGRFARLLRAETGYVFDASVHKYDGRPFTVEELLEELDGLTG
jgi:2-oxoglutarate/2-oxoacid ferredoxin oxidoreductase subunit alpha